MNWKCWKKKDKILQNRKLRANDAEYNAQFKYANNYISTSKYNFFTFLPLNLFEQFTRLANIYFLVLLILQLIPHISSLSWQTTVVPLIVVLAFSAIKDAYDDIQRHLSDRKVNNRLSWVMRDGQLVEARWRTVGVGDIIKMENDQFVAADLLLLTSSESSGLCFIETAELDGETNLKVKQAIQDTSIMGDDIQQISQFNGEVTCEPPNNVLSKFEGSLLWNNKSNSLDNNNILLRGCVLRNTEWCFGLVIFAGKDTKLMMNSGKTKFKRTHIDRLMNILIIGIFIFLLSICLACCIGAGVWETLIGTYFQAYLPWESIIPGSTLNSDGTDIRKGATVISILVFFSYIIILNTLVPISLYVSVELIRFGNSWWINMDRQMYHEKTDTPARARTTTLNEELGQIEYIFSDKTGTLTQNIMTFNKCSINGLSYGDVFNNKGQPVDITDRTPKLDFSANNPYFEKAFDFYDKRLQEAVDEGVPQVHEFFRLLALCHTVISSDKDGDLEYQAQSPDEAALVSAARNFGFVYKTRTPVTITIEVMGREEVYEQLCILDFNNVRKRMSIIVRKDNKITLLCKGADSTVYERLDPKFAKLQQQTTSHLETFAQDGLRTLCLATKDIDPNYYEEWIIKHHEASTSIGDRDDKLSEVYEEIEQGMRLLGATAIEDKLQDGVPETIANLANADIKIWVLTGDKQETAINIGYSCHLLTEEMSEHIYVVETDSSDEVREELMKARDAILKVVNKDQLGYTNAGMSISSETLKSGNSSNFFNSRSTSSKTQEFGLVINGHSLVHALKPELDLLLLEVACMCKAVICCRVTPLQKALVVNLVKKHKKSVTLAIGDGANDVSMIKMAHIGIGISGQEGMQAVLSSDYSIAQFKYLERLLLVHGRWSYLRMCKFLKYFFYKNFAFTLCHFWFAFLCGFSAQTLFDPYFITFYNIFYTSLPVMALGFFDQDVSDKFSIRYPRLYTPGHLDLFFNKKVFAQSVLEGVLTSLVLFFVPYGAYQDAIQSGGLDVAGHKAFGLVVASCLIVTVTLRCGLDTLYWTPINHVFIWGSILFYFGFIAIFYLEQIDYSYAGTATMVWSTATFWFTILLTIVIILMSVVAERFYFIDTRPTLTDKIRIQQKVGEIREKASKSRVIRRASSIRQSQRSVGRSGYAFSHQQGFGDLITSGSITRRNLKKKDVFPDISSEKNATLVGFTDLSGFKPQVAPFDRIAEEDDHSHSKKYESNNRLV